MSFDVVLIAGLGLFLGGIGVGIAMTRLGFRIGYREHLEQHEFSAMPLDCVFCREERCICNQLPDDLSFMERQP